MDWFTDVHVDPKLNNLPGGEQLQHLIDGLAAWTLLAALAGLLISLMMWAFGSHSGNIHTTGRGKIGVVVCVAVALVAGGAAQIINFFAELGSHIQ